MMAGLEVLRRMLVPRGIAATDVPASLAEAKMHPGSPDLQALLAPRRMRRRIHDPVKMGTDRGSHPGSTASLGGLHRQVPDLARSEQPKVCNRADFKPMQRTEEVIEPLNGVAVEREDGIALHDAG